MRVVFLLPMYPLEPIGGFTVIYEFASGLARRGHEVSIVHGHRLRNTAPPPRSRTVREVWRRARRATGHLLRTDRGLSWFALDPRVRMLFRRSLEARHVPDADVVVATAWQTAEYASKYPPSKGVGCYLIQHHETWSGETERVDATWRLPLHKLVIAAWLQDLAQQKGLDDVVHVPIAIDLGRFKVLSPVESRPRRVAMMYSWHPWKGTDVGLAAIMAARLRVPDLTAVIFGVTEPPAGLPPWIEVRRDPRPEELVDEIYNGAGIYLCPSLGEGWHLPPAEAMACGCAVVSTDIGGVRDYAWHDRSALLAPPGDASGLADALVRVATDGALRMRLATTGQSVIASYSWERSADELERRLRDWSAGRAVDGRREAD